MTEMQPGIEHTINIDTRREVVLASNSLVTAKEIEMRNTALEHMRSSDAMERLLRIGQTREGLAAIVAMHGQK
ncbi:MAG: hypothetical protein HZC02_00910 [Candidatus Levybacteria bacterium]|nr:hypothetical protein [Candidatus Levybacteria bacterium]